MIDHVGLNVEDFQSSIAFYRKALEPLGYGVEFEDAKAGAAGLGKKSAPNSGCTGASTRREGCTLL